MHEDLRLVPGQLDPHDLINMRVRLTRQRVVQLHLEHRFFRHHLTCNTAHEQMLPGLEYISTTITATTSI